jgi:hypothetical protein
MVAEAGPPGWPAGAPREGPLSGLRVLDLSRILAGPFATMQLADLGADVIKVEAPGKGDETRRWGPPFAADGTAAYFLAINRNKRAITLDLGRPAAVTLARRLALAADVVVDNFLPGRLERFGLDHDSLAEANPRIVTCTISGYGSDGPAAGRPGFDFLIQAEGGIMSITGQAGDQPTKVGVAIADLAAGLFGAIGVLAALRERDATGRGRRVEVSLLDAQVGLLANQAMNWLVGGVTPRPMGNAHPSISPYESYRARDGSIARSGWSGWRQPPCRPRRSTRFRRCSPTRWCGSGRWSRSTGSRRCGPPCGSMGGPPRSTARHPNWQGYRRGPAGTRLRRRRAGKTPRGTGDLTACRSRRPDVRLSRCHM